MKRRCKKCDKCKRSTEFGVVRKQPTQEVNGNPVYIFRDVCNACAK